MPLKLTPILALLLSMLLTTARAAEAPPWSVGVAETLTLETEAGKPFQAYRVGPRGARRGILLIPSSWGLTEEVRNWADWLAGEGYRVLAVDLYDGKAARSRDEALALMKAVDQAEANARYQAALRVLRAPGRKLIAMGWEFGGTQALHASLARPNAFAATVIYEGEPVADAAKLKKLRSPVLGMYAKAESPVSASQVRAFEAAMKKTKKRVRIEYYEREGIESETFYSGEAAQRVWKDTRDFIKTYVR